MTRLLDAPDGIEVQSWWNPAEIAAEPERGIVPELEVDFEDGLPAKAVSLTDFPPRVLDAAAASGTAGLRFEPPVGALCFAQTVLPETAYLLEFSARRSAPTADANVGQVIVIELTRAPSGPAGIKRLVSHLARGELRALAIHAADVSPGAFRRERQVHRTTKRTRGLLIVLLGGKPGSWMAPGAPGADASPPPGFVDFDALKLWELPLARFLPIDHRERVFAVSLLGDLRRALLAPPGTRCEIPVTLPAGRCRVSFSYGVMEERRDSWGRTPMRFRARLERSGVPPVALLATELTAAATPVSHLWQDFAVEVVGDGRPSRLLLETQSDAPSEDVGAFGEPRIEQLDDATAHAPDVLLISLDTLRADRLGCYGYARPDGRATSPRIDAFASRCLRFAQARSVAPWTLPSHATIFTGLSPTVHRVTRLGRHLIPGVHPLLATEFALAGYSTAAFTAGGFVAAEHGFSFGFDRYSSLDPFATETNIDRDLDPHAGDRAFNDAVRARRGRAGIEHWIEAQAGRPWFLFLHTYVVHDYYAPAELERALAGDSPAPFPPGRDLLRIDHELVSAGKPPPPELLSTVRNVYDACVAAADAEVGALLEWLESSGRLDRTIVAIVADHGEEHGEHGGLGHGHSLYEELLRVPFLLHVPGIAPQVVDEPVDLCDVAPTLREAAGLPPVLPCDGESVLTRLRTGSFRDAFWAEAVATPGSEHALRIARFKLLQRPPELPQNASRKTLRPSAWELYDLDADPSESNNLLPLSPLASPLDTRPELPPSFRALGRRFEAERAAGRARRDALLPAGTRLDQSIPDDLRQRLEELGYATTDAPPSDDD